MTYHAVTVVAIDFATALRQAWLVFENMNSEVDPCLSDEARWLGAVVLIFAGVLRGDVIYLKSGSVFVVEKAWQEGDQVKYQTASGIQTIQLSSVKKLQGQKAAPADPSRHLPVQAVVVRGQDRRPPLR